MVEIEEIRRRFAEHVAVLTEVKHPEVGNILFLRWRQPQSWTYSIEYVFKRGMLIVTGDCYDAIYQAGANDLEWWSRCDRSYFASKCLASPYGRGFRTWSDRRAESRIPEILRTIAHRRREGLITKDQLRDLRDDMKSGSGADPRLAIYSEWEWHEWLREHGDDLIGGDCWEWASIGTDVAWECATHLEGLRMALDYLHRQKESSAA